MTLIFFLANLAFPQDPASFYISMQMRTFTLKITRILSLMLLVFAAGAGSLAAQNATISGIVAEGVAIERPFSGTAAA